MSARIFMSAFCVCAVVASAAMLVLGLSDANYPLAFAAAISGVMNGLWLVLWGRS